MKKKEQKKSGKYIEKELYSFLIKKEINFEGENYFILQSKFESNHLLPTKYYTDYQLSIGNFIDCYVDKINCAGEVFLEAIHPFYQLNKIYSFKILRAGQHKFKDSLDSGLFVEDLFGHERFVALELNEMNSFLEKKEIPLKLLRIKKGKFWLCLTS